MYKYYLHNGSTTVEIHPKNGGRTIKATRDNAGFYRFELTGNVILTGSEFDIIRGYESTNTQLYLEIRQRYNGNWQQIFYGYFFPFDCRFDLDSCEVSIKVTSKDIYDDMMKGFDEKYNVIQLLRQNKTVYVSYVGSSQYELETDIYYNQAFPVGSFISYDISGEISSALSAFQTGASPQSLIDYIHQNNVSSPGKWRIFKYQIAFTTQPTFSLPPGGTTLKQSDNVAVGNVRITKVRQIRYIVKNQDGTYNSPGADWEEIQTLNFVGSAIVKYAKQAGGAALDPFYVYRIPGDSEDYNHSTQYETDANYYIQLREQYLNLEQNDKTLTNKFGSLYGVINYIWKQVSGSTLPLAVKSDLLFPLGNNTTNPLDGSENEYQQQKFDGTNFQIRSMLLCQKSDYKTPNATEPATLAECSLRVALDLLKGLFNDVGWFIETDGSLRIEHKVYFENGLTYGTPATGAATDLRAEVEVKRGNKYTYDTKRMASIIRSRYSEASGLDFTGLDCQLTVPNNIDNVIEKEFVIDQFTADLNYIDESPGSISDSGFVIVVAEKAYDMPLDSYRVVNYLCPLTNSVQTNGLLALTTLYSKFFIYGMPFASVNINGRNVVTTKTLKNKLQESFNVAWCNGNFTPYVLFRTGLGYGFPETMELNITDQRMNMQLLQL